MLTAILLILQLMHRSNSLAGKARPMRRYSPVTLPPDRDATMASSERQLRVKKIEVGSSSESISEQLNTSREATMDRRTFLATATAAAAVTMKAASAATVTPFGQTGAPSTSTDPLPLGPLPGSRYPDPHLESAK